MISETSPEFHIVKIGCGADNAAADDSLRELVQSHIDWNAVFLCAMWNKVLFVLYERLKKIGYIDLAMRDGTLGLLLLNHWKQLAAVNFHRNRIHLAELTSIARALQETEANYCLAKGGPALFGRAYSIEERKTYDIDLLASRSELAKINKAFAEAGYLHAHYSNETGELQALDSDEIRKWLLHSRGLPNFLKLTGDGFMPYVVIQVQFRIGSALDQEYLPSDEFLARRVLREGVHFVNDDDLYIQTLMHLYRETIEPSFAEWHMSWNLIKFCDIDRLTRYFFGCGQLIDGIDRVVQLKLERQCLYSLRLVSKVYPSEAIAQAITMLAEGRSILEHEIPELSTIERLIASTGFASDVAQSEWTKLVPLKTN